MLHKNKSNYLYCFSPPVMLASFCIELGLAIYVLVRYRQHKIVLMSVLLLGILAGFQFAEYNVCRSQTLWGWSWAKIGYALITLLPPLGLHIVSVISGMKRQAFVALSYVFAGAWISYFLFASHNLSSAACTGNYVIFNLTRGSAYLYGLYYYGFLLAAIWVAVQASQSTSKKLTLALRRFCVGYGLFLIPTILVYMISDSARAGIPSIMCGFAVLFAMVLVFGILPIIDHEKR